MSDLGNNTP